MPVLREKANKLFFGDNISALKILLYEYNMHNKIDLIYIDPPFATNTVFKADNNKANTISMPNKGSIAYEDTIIGDEFLEFMRERLILAKELLSNKGSIYLHIDYKIGHYIKILMDEIFGSHNFRNDIARIKCNPKNFKRKAYGNIKDMILFYSKTKDNIWNQPYLEYTNEDIRRLYKKQDKNHRHYTTVPLHAPGETKNGLTSQPFKGILPPSGRHWRCSPEELEELDKKGLIEWSGTNNPRKIIYADERIGKKMQDIWDFKDSQYPQYPTEKNLDMLRKIIKTSSNKDSIILDFFCGSGTTLVAAEELSRQWIGIDKSPKAIEITQKRLQFLLNIYSREIQFIDITKSID
ncbi:hypothetical protein BKH45_02810 [Helicobacter sp. 11S03491-1]|nr:hypothetical protein BKH45_02810 [Helicobacter sp. 11S03491-1]